MNIDWITIGAQVLNFLILVWLMKHFLYKPILNAIDARESRIEAELKNADLKKDEAQRERNEFLQKNQEFNRQRADLLNQMTDEVKAERQRLLEEAHKAADELSSKRQEKLRNEAHSLMNTMNDWTRQEVFAITRKTLEDLASTSLEERLGEVFLRRLREMDDKTKDSFAQALKTTDEPALLRSAFELPTEQRVAIQKALNEICAAEIHVPKSINAVVPLVGQILVESEMRRSQGEMNELHLFYSRPTSGAVYAPVSQRLLPLDEKWRRNLAEIPWPEGNLPEILGSDAATLRALIREYLFISLFRACTESLASENASRLAAMQRADKNIDELLESLNNVFYRLRQSNIDEELFDVISGFEALNVDNK